jgi:anti-anti-sigma factor
MDEVEEGLSASVSGVWDKPDALTVTIAGELDIASVGPVQRAIEDILTEACRTAVFELGDLTFMDSSGLALMVQVSKQVDRVEIRHATAIVRRVIEATGLEEILGLQP